MLLKDPYTFVLRLTLVCLAGDILLTGGFMLLRVPPVGPGVPINELLLAFDLIAILLMRHANVGFSTTPVMLPLTLLWMQGTVHLVIGLYGGGFWAVRDAASLIEAAYLFVGFWLASDPRFLPIFSLWLRRVLVVAAFYMLLYPVQDYIVGISPVVTGVSGYSVPLLFSYSDASTIAVTAACQMMVSNYGAPMFRMLLTAATVMVLVVFVQARLAYIQLGFLFLLVMIFKPQRLGGLGSTMLATAALVGLFLVSGIELPGRLGTTFTLDFLVNHLAAIWGSGGHDATTDAAAQGVGLRVGWWANIDNWLRQDVSSWLFGLGYGNPLTTFRGPADDIVREPHNSFVSVYGRLGVFGLVNFIPLQIAIVATTVRLIVLSKRSGAIELHGLAITILCFLGAHLIFSLGEGGFEMSFAAVTYYFFAGVVLAQFKALSAREADRYWWAASRDYGRRVRPDPIL